LNPKDLYIGWVENCNCVRCAESYIYELLEPKLNVNRPPTCKEHKGEERYTEAFDTEAYGT